MTKSARELIVFGLVLATLIAMAHAKTLLLGMIRSPADLLFVSASFRDERGPLYEPTNRLLTDPVLQFEPWIEHNRQLLRQGRLPLWNDFAGCGVPHLANGQSAVFDPFHLIAYLGKMPDAIGWMVAARLGVAGLGMFLLARAWHFGRWGRWFAGLVYPFCGFLTVWLLYPVTSVSIWLPWLIWTTEKCLRKPGVRSVAALAIVVGLTLLGGHVQTSAHCLMAAGLYAVWRGRGLVSRLSFGVAVILGVTLAAIEVLPLWVYLGKSPVWADRATERPSPLTVKKPRLLDSLCTAVPYIYGSQIRGQPHLARAVGVQNLNESAGGFTGLVTLIWLAPLAVWTRYRSRRVQYLIMLTVIGGSAAFEIPPIPNLLRLIPVLNVMDHRRLTLWVAFGLTLLGGIGLDRMSGRLVPRFTRGMKWLGLLGQMVLLCGSIGVLFLESSLRRQSLAHYARMAETTLGADPEIYRERALRQVENAVAFLPYYYGMYALICFCVAFMIVWPWSLRDQEGCKKPVWRLQAIAFALALFEVVAFGYKLNPAISRADDRPVPPVIAYLQTEVGNHGRVLGLGEELPPNTLMRYGLSDIRDYDSIELERAWKWFEPLYTPGLRERTSRRDVNWEGVQRAKDRLIGACVQAIVSAYPPPPGMFNRVDKVGEVWVARLPGKPIVEGAIVDRFDHGIIDLSHLDSSEVIIRQMFDSGWSAEADGRPVRIEPLDETFIKINHEPGVQALSLRYQPAEARIGLSLTIGTLFCLGFGLTSSAVFESIRRTSKHLDFGKLPR